MKRRILAAVLLLGAIFVGGRFAYIALEKSTPAIAEADPSPPSRQPINPKRSPIASAISESGEDADARSIGFNPPRDLAAADELVATFADGEAYRDFLAQSEIHGVEIIEQNDALRSLRLRAADAAQANRIGELAGEGASIEYNYLIAAPSFPDTSRSGLAAAPFEDQALAWLGVPADNREWGKDITIALLDTGVLEHAAVGSDNVDHMELVEAGPETDSEYQSHGTAIASLLVGELGVGMVPSANLLSIQVMDSNGLGNSFTLAEGIMTAVDSGAQVISMSLGSYGYSTVLRNAVDYALANGAAIIAAAGNDGASISPYPASFEGVIGVGAVDAEERRADFSNIGHSVDIMAPGVGVYAAWGDNDWIAFSGTSAAVPFVAGAVAATLSSDDRLSASDAVDIVLELANDISAPGEDLETGMGILNLDRILNRNESGIYDAAIADLHLDTANGSESTTPLHVTVENRGTERLGSVSLSLSQNEGYSQRIYLGPLSQNQTTAYTLYLDNSQLAPELGLTIDASTVLNGAEDSRPANDAKSARITIVPMEPQRD